jgi:hypothetical protein
MSVDTCWFFFFQRCLTTCDLVVKSFSPEASDRHNGTEDQAGGNNSDSEDAEDDEEEDKESDGYESPPMVCHYFSWSY